MKCKLIAYTQPTDDFKSETNIENVQELISYCARVSNPSAQINNETTEKLLSYMIDHMHFSPFEMASATIEIETTRDIARQILRHRSFSFQEFSQRYKEVDALGEAFVIREARFQHPKNRQDSIEFDMENAEHLAIATEWARRQQIVIDIAKQQYDWAISAGVGIAKEQARAVLPEGNTVSRLYMQGTIRSWIHYIQLRSGNGTQKEHMEIAIEVAKAIHKIFPLSEKFISN